MAHQIGTTPEKIITGVASFTGMKRRLEKRLVGKVMVYDDIAHSPTKAQAVLETIKKITAGKVVTVLSPILATVAHRRHRGTTTVFDSADEVIIPRLTKVKLAEGEEAPFEAEDLVRIISKTYKPVKNINDDQELIEYLVKNTKEGDAIMFLGSHGFRGMIDELIKKL